MRTWSLPFTSHHPITVGRGLARDGLVQVLHVYPPIASRLAPTAEK